MDVSNLPGEPVQPTGTVTFLFTDVESSTKWWASDPAAMSKSLQVHDTIIREVVARHNGYTFSTAGDSFAAAFSRASSAVSAAEEVQLRLQETAWPGPPLRVRIGLHLGEAEERDGDYFGSPVNTAARVEATGHGGQIVITELVRAAVGVSARDLGLHQLRGVSEPLRLFQIGDESFPPLRVADAMATNLPARPTRLIGRESDIAIARQSLRVGRLVTITGIGGAGKTRLAIAIGEEELPHRPDGVWFVDLTSVTSGENIAGAVSGAMGLRLAGSDVAAALFRYVKDKDLLIILDNCEHLIDASAEFAERFLATRSPSVLLATSRETLDIDGERTFPLPMLTTDSVDPPAVRLFVDRASAIDPHFTLDPTNTETIRSLCTRLDGLPLAIELAAARITVMTPGELLAGLDDRFRLLDGGRRRQRQRTLDATLDWSYELLDPDQRALFRLLGVFAGGFDLEAVVAIHSGAQTAPDHAGHPPSGVPTRRLLEALVAKSLVVRADPGPSISDGKGGTGARFLLLETVKAYAESRLRSDGGFESVRNQHLDHYHRLATSHGRVMVPEVGLGARLGNERGNLTAAFEWAVAQHRWVAAGELLLGALPAYELQGSAREGMHLYRLCINGVRAVDAQLADYLTVAVLLSLALLDSWGEVREVAQGILGSSDANCRLAGYGLLSLATFPLDRSASKGYMKSAEACLAEIVSQPRDLNSELAQLWLALVRANIAGYSQDLDRVRAFADELVLFESRNQYVSFLSMRMSAMASACSVIFGEPGLAISTVDRFRVSASNDTFGDDIRAFAYLALNELEPARELIRRHAKRGIEGRTSREANDSVLLLGALAHAEGDHDIAESLIMQTGFCRHIATTLLGRDLAARMGVSGEHATSQARAHSFSSADEQGVLGMTMAMNALRAELARRDWS